jgi:hypothetical protein
MSPRMFEDKAPKLFLGIRAHLVLPKKEDGRGTWGGFFLGKGRAVGLEVLVRLAWQEKGGRSWEVRTSRRSSPTGERGPGRPSRARPP